MTLRDFFAAYPRAALAFSGGTDSAYLLYAALRCGAEVQPYFIKTVFQTAEELENARALCRSLNVPLRVIECDILAASSVRENGADRCYHCKRALFTVLLSRAKEDGYEVVLEGTNASDNSADRPGMRAVKELGVLSPLRECGVTKSEIRARSREAGLSTADTPSRACLATRVPTGRTIEETLLERAEGAENALYAMGYNDLRVRILGECARLQLPEEQLPRAVSEREAIRSALKPYFSDVLLDLRSRRGL